MTWARRWVRVRVGEWGFPGLARDGELVVAELAANAVLHGGGEGGSFRVGLMLGTSALRVGVVDGRGSRWPVPRPVTEGEVGGRGLALVRGFADRCGVTQAGGEKAVWAEFALPAVQ